MIDLFDHLGIERFHAVRFAGKGEQQAGADGRDEEQVSQCDKNFG
jgi:hypothetical protein